MRKILLTLAVIFGAGCLPALMGPTGGYPSFPTFGGITIPASQAKPAVPAAFITANATTGQSDGVYIRGGTNTSDYALQVGNQSGSANGLIVNGLGHTLLGGAPDGISGVLFMPATNGQIQDMPFGAGAVLQSGLQWFQDNNLYLDSPGTGTPAGGTIYLRQGGNTPVNLASFATTGSYINGTRVPKTAYASFSSTCSTNFVAGGIASCTRGGAGLYQVIFNAGVWTSLNSYACTASSQGAGATILEVTGPGATAINVTSLTTGGVGNDQAFYIICVGT